MKNDNKVPHSMVNLIRPRADGAGITAIRVGSGAAAGFGGGGGGGVGGVDGSVQYNLNGGPGGDTNLTWNYTAQEFGVVSLVGSAGISVTNGYIGSDGGFDALKPGWNAFQGAPEGAGAFLAGVGVAPSGVAGATNGGYIDLADLGYGNYPAPLDGAQFVQPQVLLWNSGINGTAPGDVNTTTGLMTNAFVDAAAGFATQAPEWNAIQAPMGGVFGQSLTALNYLHIGDMPADPVPGVTMTYGDNLTPGTMYWNTTTGQAMIYNGTQFVPLGGGGNPGGIQGSVQYNNGGAFGGDVNLFWNPSAQEFYIRGVGGQALTVDNGYTASGGFVSTINSWQAIDSVGAGVAGGALTAGYGLTPFQGVGGYIDIAPLVNQVYPVPLPGLASFGINDVLLWVAAENGSPSLGNLYGLQCSSYIDAAEGFATADPRYNSVQTVGGFNGRSLAVTDYVQVGHSASDPTLGPGVTPGDSFQQGALYWNDQKNDLLVFNGIVWLPIGAGGFGNIGVFGSVQYNLNGGLAGDQNFVWSQSTQQLFVNGMSTGQAAITVSGGYVRSDGGYLSTAQDWNAFNGADSGGGAYLASGTFVPYGGTGGYLSLLALGYAAYPQPVAPSGSFNPQAALIWAAGRNDTGQFGNPGPPPGLSLCTNMSMDAAGGFVTGVAAYNAVQATNGGMYALAFHALNYVDIGVNWGPPPYTPGITNWTQGSLYYDSSLNAPRMWDGIQWFTLGGGMSNLEVPCVAFASSASSITTSPNMFWEASTNALGVTALGVNGITGASQVRISAGRVNSGMFLTSTNSGQANIAGGKYWNGGSFVATDPNPTEIDMEQGQIQFFCDTGYVGRTQRMVIDYNGNLSVQSGVFSPNHVANVPGGGFWAVDAGGAANRLMLSMGSNNDVYLDNNTLNDIYIRPASGRFVFLGNGLGGMEWVCPNGDNLAYLGAPWYRWNNVYTYNLDVAGTVSGVTRTVNGLWGDVGIAAGTGVSIYNSGNSVVINSTGGAGNPFNQSLNTYNDVNFNTVTTQGVVQAGAASGNTFQNTNWEFRVDSGGTVYSQGVQTNSLYVNGVACVTWGGVWVGGGVQSPGQIYGSIFGIYGRYVGFPTDASLMAFLALTGYNNGSEWVPTGGNWVYVCGGLIVNVLAA